MLNNPIEVSLRDFGEADRPRLDEWARRIDSTTYMSRYAPKAGECLLWCVIEAHGTDVGTVWLERAAASDEANLGILLGDPCLFGQGIGKRAIDLAIAKACSLVPLRVIRLHVRDDNARAIACYEHCGFRVVGSGTREAGGRRYGFFGMEKRLDNESAT